MNQSTIVCTHLNGFKYTHQTLIILFNTIHEHIEVVSSMLHSNLFVRT